MLLPCVFTSVLTIIFSVVIRWTQDDIPPKETDEDKPAEGLASSSSGAHPASAGSWSMKLPSHPPREIDSDDDDDVGMETKDSKFSQANPMYTKKSAEKTSNKESANANQGGSSWFILKWLWGGNKAGGGDDDDTKPLLEDDEEEKKKKEADDEEKEAAETIGWIKGYVFLCFIILFFNITAYFYFNQIAWVSWT